MKSKALIRFFPIFVALISAICLALPANAATVVEVPGKQLPNLLGQTIDSIRVFASTDGGSAKVIPFQIDEKDSKGQWVMDSASAGGSVLDPQDVLLFHLDDAGVALAGAQVPEGKARAQIFAGGKYVYVIASDTPMAKSSKSYVSYSPTQDRVSTAFYDIGFNLRQALVQDVLVLHNGSKVADILDRFKVRFNLAIKNFFNFKIEESDVQARVAGTRVGPIRVVRRVVATKKLGPINVIPKSITDFLFYPNWVEVPTTIQNPIEGPKFLEDKTQGLSGYDFTHEVYGSILYASVGTSSATLNGLSEDSEKAFEQGAATWWSLNGPTGSLVVGIQNDPKLEQLGIRPSLRVIDDAKKNGAPEGEAGESFVGFDLPYHKIPKGSYSIRVRQVFPWRFEHGQETSYLNAAKSVPAEAVQAL